MNNTTFLRTLAMLLLGLTLFLCACSTGEAGLIETITADSQSNLDAGLFGKWHSDSGDIEITLNRDGTAQFLDDNDVYLW